VNSSLVQITSFCSITSSFQNSDKLVNEVFRVISFPFYFVCFIRVLFLCFLFSFWKKRNVCIFLYWYSGLDKELKERSSNSLVRKTREMKNFIYLLFWFTNLYMIKEGETPKWTCLLLRTSLVVLIFGYSFVLF